MYPGVRASQKLTEFTMHYLYHLLPGGEAFQDLFAYGLCLDLFNEILYNLEIYISFEQGETHLFQGSINIFFLEDTFAPQFLKYGLKFFAQRLKHYRSASISCEIFSESSSIKPMCFFATFPSLSMMKA